MTEDEMTAEDDDCTVTNSLCDNIRYHLIRADILYSWIEGQSHDFLIGGSGHMRDGSYFEARHCGKLYRITVEEMGE